MVFDNLQKHEFLIFFQNEKLDDYNFVPKLQKKSSKKKEKEEFKGLLGDDDDDEDDDEVGLSNNLLMWRYVNSSPDN